MCPSPSGGKYYILGGQHFCEALRLYRKWVLNEKIYPNEAALPAPLQEVLMEVFLETTPLHVRASAAGRHQRKQEGFPASHSDFLAVAVEMAALKRKIYKTDWMSDNDVFFCPERSGLRGDEESRMEEKSSKKIETEGNQPVDVDKELASRVCSFSIKSLQNHLHGIPCNPFVLLQKTRLRNLWRNFLSFASCCVNWMSEEEVGRLVPCIERLDQNKHIVKS